MGRQVFGTRMASGNVFANPTASSSAHYPQESNPWVTNVSEHTSPHVMGERQTPVTIRDASQDCQPDSVTRSKKWRWLNQWMISSLRVL